MKEWIADKIEEVLQNYFGGVKARALENVDILMNHLIDTLHDVSYLLALYGGAACIIGKLCGSTRAGKYFLAFQFTHLFVKGML